MVQLWSDTKRVMFGAMPLSAIQEKALHREGRTSYSLKL